MRTFSGYSIDSREVKSGDLFIALPGEHVDGHDYVAAAFAKGAAAALVERRVEGNGLQLVVPNTLAAMQSLATSARATWGKTIVAITGSAGKTSSKEAVASLLSIALPVSRTVGNLNNHIGLPLSVLRVDEASEVAVLEMGMNHAG